jgi:hypothetical protein
MNPEILQKLLGGGQIALGAMGGNSRLMGAGMNRVGPQGHAVPPSIPGGQPDPSVYGTPPMVPPPGAPPVVPPSYTRLPYSTGGGSPMPTRPGFRMPSSQGGEYGNEM